MEAKKMIVNTHFHAVNSLRNAYNSLEVQNMSRRFGGNSRDTSMTSLDLAETALIVGMIHFLSYMTMRRLL